VRTLVTAHDIKNCAHYIPLLHSICVHHAMKSVLPKITSKQLTSLNILGLYLHLGSTEGYYNPLPLFMHCPQCIMYPYTTKFSKSFKNMQVFCLHFILMLPSSVFRSVPGPLDLYKPYGSIPELFDFSIQDACRMHLESTFLLHLNNIPINNMISIGYIFL
jgi:hypothetical protein